MFNRLYWVYMSRPIWLRVSIWVLALLIFWDDIMRLINAFVIVRSPFDIELTKDWHILLIAIIMVYLIRVGSVQLVDRMIKVHRPTTTMSERQKYSKVVGISLFFLLGLVVIAVIILKLGI